MLFHKNPDIDNTAIAIFGEDMSPRVDNTTTYGSLSNMGSCVKDNSQDLTIDTKFEVSSK